MTSTSIFLGTKHISNFSPLGRRQEVKGMIAEPIPTILTVGPNGFPRYIILADSSAPPEERQYWAGAKWIDKPNFALLYADRHTALEDLKKITAEQSQS